jgi:phytoene desaturase
MSSHTPSIVVIGAGIGGLSAAISLAAAGRRVLVLEQQAQVGGKMSQVVAEGYRFDTGPSVITMRHVIEDLFRLAGRDLADYLDLVAVEPLTRYLFPDGRRLDVTRDWPNLARQIADFDPADVAGYLRFLAFASDIHRVTGPVFIYNEPPSLGSFLRVPPRDMLRVDAWSTMDRAISRYVRNPQLRQLLARFATYVGASPYHAPATLSVVAHVELTGGVWYPRGGVYAIAEAMARLASDLGVEIRTSVPVQEIIVERGRAIGVHTRTGERIAAAHIVANVDVATVYNRMLPPDAVPSHTARRLGALPTSCSGFVMLLGVQREHRELAHHNILFCADYRREFEDIFRRGVPPTDPTVYVAITSKSDPSHAPEGCENWFVLVNAPPLGDAFDWATGVPAYRELVLSTIARHGFDIRNHIAYEQIRTPHAIADLTGAWRGALYGISSNNPLNAFRRPHIRCPHVRGLYFAGGTTHPGGGVPMVTLSGMTAANILMRDPSFA